MNTLSMVWPLMRNDDKNIIISCLLQTDRHGAFMKCSRAHVFFFFFFFFFFFLLGCGVCTRRLVEYLISARWTGSFLCASSKRSL